MRPAYRSGGLLTLHTPCCYTFLTLVIASVLAGVISLKASVTPLARPAPPGQTNHKAVTPEERSRALVNLANLPLAFEPNRGQTSPDVKYLAKGREYTFFSRHRRPFSPFRNGITHPLARRWRLNLTMKAKTS